MRICKGRKRFVLVFPTIGIAIKLPIIIWASNNLKRLVKLAFGRKVSFVEKLDCSFYLLFRGITDNWNEFQFYLRTRHPFVIPTYFSFFGLLNIQRAGEKLNKVTQENLIPQLFRLAVKYSGWVGSVLTGDGHHWETPANFCFWQGKLRILDYGSQHTQELIIAYGRRIQEDFDSSYRYNREEWLSHFR